MCGVLIRPSPELIPDEVVVAGRRRPCAQRFRTAPSRRAVPSLRGYPAWRSAPTPGVVLSSARGQMRSAPWPPDSSAEPYLHPVGSRGEAPRIGSVSTEPARGAVACASVLSPERAFDLSGTSTTPSLHGTGKPLAGENAVAESAFSSEIPATKMERSWSPVATGGNQWQSVGRKSGRNKPKPLPWVATGCRSKYMVRRGSPVRVRKRALQNPRKRPFLIGTTLQSLWRAVAGGALCG